MFGSETIEVVIGLAFVYLLFSLVCSTLTEAVARMLRLRTGTLQKAIDNMLNGHELEKRGQTPLELFYEHDLIQSLTQPSWYDRLLKSKWLCFVCGSVLLVGAVIIVVAPVFQPQYQWLGQWIVFAIVAFWFGLLLVIAGFFHYRID
jgi:hypothetical protein